MALAGCTALPSSGPDGRAVDFGATVKMSKASNGKPQVVGTDYALIDLNERMLGYFGATNPTSFSESFRLLRRGAPGIPLGVGDIVAISVFESQAGGLFIPADAGSRPGNFVTLPAQTIGQDGNISVPYAGRIRAAGRSVAQLQKQIEDQLANRAIEPQVIITKVASRSAQVTVLGDVRAPTKVEISEAGERILDVISSAGGLSAPNVETYITLQRPGRTATISYSTLIANPNENVFVGPGDTVIVNRERRTFAAFGASGLNGRFDFEETNLTLSEALAKAGGLLDGRANPSHVLLYRYVSRQTLADLGVDVSKFHATEVPVVFRANLRDPSSFFLTQKFAMQDKDISTSPIPTPPRSPSSSASSTRSPAPRPTAPATSSRPATRFVRCETDGTRFGDRLDEQDKQRTRRAPRRVLCLSGLFAEASGDLSAVLGKIVQVVSWRLMMILWPDAPGDAERRCAA